MSAFHSRCDLACKALAWLLLAVGSSAGAEITDAASDNVRIESVSWSVKPNYATNRAGNPSILADGRTARDPVWVRSGTAVWVRRTPLSLALELSQSLAPTRDYELKLHLGKEFRSGVRPPRRIDIYCHTAIDSGIRHIGTIDTVSQDTLAEQSGWIATGMRGCDSSKLELVLHADGRFIAVDEISLSAQPQSTATRMPFAATPETGGISDTAADSLKKMQTALIAKRRDQLNATLVDLGIETNQAWFASPWGRLDPVDEQAGEALRSMDSQAAIGGTGAPAHAVIGVLNTAPATAVFSLDTDDGAMPGRIEVRELKPVLAVDGRYVFDAIGGPVSSIAVEPRDVGFFWLTTTREAEAGSVDITVRDDNAWSQSLTLDIESGGPAVSDIRHLMPKALVWGYASDEPIWSEPATVADELQAGGVNVFVVHPASIPKLTDRSTWISRDARFRRELALYRDRGIVLLFVSWQRELSRADMGQRSLRNAMRAWLKKIGGDMESAGYAKNQWAVYPVDEPRGDTLEQTAEWIAMLKDIDPEVQVYLNPIAPTRTDFKYRRLIRSLAESVDYWQPRRGQAYDIVQQALNNAPNATPELWMYHNPREPAKAELPLCYRAMGWRAHEMGAAGVGFWSYSGTDGSSAWNDFDGRGPDWAVVYESTPEPISSRRWEAFKAGLRDYALLKICEDGSTAPASVCGELRSMIDALDDTVCP